MGNCLSCCESMSASLNQKLINKYIESKDEQYEPLLADREREAVADLLSFLEDVSECRLL